MTEAKGESGVDPKTILYELIGCAEWTEEKEDPSPLALSSEIGSRARGLLSALNPSKYFLKNNEPSLSPSESSKWIRSLGPQWKYSMSPDGKIIAILQNNILETRSCKDNFASTLGRANVPKDGNPNFRNMAWNHDSSLLAIAFTNGVISVFDIMVSQLYSVRRFAQPSLEGPVAVTAAFNTESRLAGLFFIEERLKKTTYCSELVSVDDKGQLQCYRQQHVEQMELHHEFSFRRYYPCGTTSVKYSEKHSLLFVAGFLAAGLSSQGLPSPDIKYGITAWRLLLDHPYYKIAFSIKDSELQMDSSRGWKLAFASVFPRKVKSEDQIFKMQLSPNEQYIAALHSSGTVSIWNVPSLRLLRLWPLKVQFQYNTENPRFNNRWRRIFNSSRNQVIDPWRFYPYDVNWWDDESIITSRVNGCLTICSILEDDPNSNLLGDSPELFESPVSVTQKIGKGFFVLEDEIRSNSKNEGSTDLHSQGLVSNHRDFWLKTIAQEFLFWTTDMEQFRPPRKTKKRIPVWIETHRLFNLRRITPQELFSRKIEREEYGEALDLARAYQLDSDLVYQRQWTKNPVTVNTIRDYLAKIKKRNWVLQEVIDRVPENIDAARELLEFGLRGTDLGAAVMIEQGRDDGKFILWSPDDLDISEEEYISLIDPSNSEVLRLLQYRKQILGFLSMLSTYELILGGPIQADESFDGKSCGELRRKHPSQSAIEMARKCDTNGLAILLTNHWTDISATYLEVLSNFPETTSPHDYRDFLPELDGSGCVILWDDYLERELDWCENILNGLETSNDRKSDSGLTPQSVQNWYERRIRQIESSSGLVNYALSLARLAVERNFRGLQFLVHDLETLETLVYDLCIDDMSLTKMQDLNPSEMIDQLMSKASKESFVDHLRQFVVPYLIICEKRNPGSRFELFNNFLTSISKESLSLPLKVFEESLREQDDPIISDIEELMKLAYNCIYACQNSGEGEHILAILGCLPDRGYGLKSSNIEKLHKAMDELEVHYRATQVLEKYGMTISLKSLKRITEKDAQEEFLRSVCRTASKKVPALKVLEWKGLLYDILELQKKIFTSFPMEACFEIYVEALLGSGSVEIINLAREFLEKSRGEPSLKPGLFSRTSSSNSFYSSSFALYLHVIPYQKGLEMVLQAAQIYFDSASNYLDPDIELAKVCLNILQNSKEPSVAQFFDLIDAIKLINKDFQLNILPQKVRYTQDKIRLLQLAVENRKGGYKKIQQLQKLVFLLHIDNMDISEAESLVLEMAGDAALQASDLKLGYQICESIMGKGYKTGWKLFTTLAKLETDSLDLDIKVRMAFIDYALGICPDEEIMDILKQKCLIEIRSLQNRITSLSPSDSTVDTTVLEEEETIVGGVLNKNKIDKFLQTTTSWIAPLKEMADVIKTGSGVILSGGRSSSLDGGSMMPGGPFGSITNEGFHKEGYPMFYVHGDSQFVHTSDLSSKYDSFSSSGGNYTNNPALELCVVLNRIWHLEKMLLNSDEVGYRDEKVLEKLVCEILPEDTRWGLAILLSISNEETSTLLSIIHKLPETRTAMATILYFLSLRIHLELKQLKSIAEDGLCFKNPNQLIDETSQLLSDSGSSIDKNYILKSLSDLFVQYSDKLKLM